MNSMHFDTIALHAGYPPKDQPGAFLPGPQFAATYVLPGDPAGHPLHYGRFDNPTWSAWEDALTVLEGGPAIAFPSGMAAVTAVFATVLKPGDTVLLPSDAYYTTRLLAQNWYATMGVEVRMAPTRDSAQREHLKGVRLLWLESPSNPQLDVCDIAALAFEARAQGTLVAVDNTTATPALQRPLSLGATFSVASDTKALTGHSDLLLGHVATSDPEWLARLRSWRTQGGAIPGPMETWLAHRALGTLGLRLTRQCDNAEALAYYLSTHAGVTAVHYPGLPSSPNYPVMRRQMSRAGCVVSFDLGSRERAQSFLTSLHLVREATSFGGVHSTAERRARWGGDAVPEGFIRFSCGAEATADLLADVAQALEAPVPRR
jgi:cystathionine gamma-lyase